MTYTIDLGLSIRVSRVRETGDWDIFLGPLEWARAETGGADHGCYSEGDSQGLPGFIHPCVLGIPTISFQ